MSSITDHTWVLIGHVHLGPPEVSQLIRDGDLHLSNVELCDPEPACARCQRPFSPDEAARPCDGEPVSYTRSGEPLHWRDN